MCRKYATNEEQFSNKAFSQATSTFLLCSQYLIGGGHCRTEWKNIKDALSHHLLKGSNELECNIIHQEGCLKGTKRPESFIEMTANPCAEWELECERIDPLYLGPPVVNVHIIIRC